MASKVLHGQRARQTKDFATENSLHLIYKISLKHRTLNLTVLVNDQALTTNLKKKLRFKTFQNWPLAKF